MNTKISQTGVGLATKDVKFTYAPTGLNTRVERDVDGLLKVKTTNAYDLYGRLTGIEHRDSANVIIGKSSYIIDNLDRLQTETVDGQIRTIGYDSIDQVKTFDSFGRVLSETNPSVSFRYGYTGRERDLESGLSYYRARYYDPQVGRFISVDPMGFGAGDTNLYRYVGNSSTMATDPSGNLPIPLLVLGGIALAGAAISAFQNYSYQKAQLADGIHPNNYPDGNKADVNLGDVAVRAVGGGVVAPLAALGVAIAPLAAVPLIGLGLWSGVENHSTAQAEYDAGHTNTAWYHEKMAFVDILTAGLFHSTSRPPSTLSPALAGGAGALLDVATAVPSLLSSAGAGLIGSSVGSLFQHYFAMSEQSAGSGKKDTTTGYINSEGVPIPRKEDVTDGPHGPSRSIVDVVARAFGKNKDGTPKKGSGPQGKWLSEEAGYEAVKNLDVEKMAFGTAYSVPIPPKAGKVIRPVKVYPERELPLDERYFSENANRAIVIKKPDGIHTYPIGQENPAYHVEAPVKK